METGFCLGTVRSLPKKKTLVYELHEKNCVLKNEIFISGSASDRDSGIL
jgi:hypothetical protein